MSATTTTARQAPPPLLKRMVIDHPLVAFFVLAFVGTWAVLLPSVLFESGLGLIPISLPVPSLLFLPPAVIAGPPLAAFVVTRIVEGKEGTRELRRRILRWRVGIHWYLIVLFGLPVAYFLVASLVFGTAPLNALTEKWPLIFTSYLPNVLVTVLVASVWEETGWAGFATPRMQDKYGPLLTSVVLGTLWALWHLPWYFTSGVVVDEKVGLADLERLLYLLPLLILMAIPSRIVMTWLFNSAMGSVIIVTLFHAGWDTTNTKIIPAFMPGLDKVFATNALLYAIFYAIALLLIVFTKVRLSYKPDHAAPPAEDAEDAPSSKAERRIPGSNMPSG